MMDKDAQLAILQGTIKQVMKQDEAGWFYYCGKNKVYTTYLDRDGNPVKVRENDDKRATNTAAI